MDTTKLDGAACVECGEDAFAVYAIAEGSRLEDRALCGPCHDDLTTICPSCLYLVWQSDCQRIGYVLYCNGCAMRHPAVVGSLEAALKADEQQDAFNETRR
jgi:hypothetical protein